MSATAALLMFLLAWLGIGVVASIVMGRRGHAPFTWAALGAALGPIVIVLAAESIRREREPAELVLRAGTAGRGPVDVVVGIDGSAESEQALTAVIELLGSRLGRLTLAAVLDFDTAESSEEWDERQRAERSLADATARVGALSGDAAAGEVLLAGRPAAALVRYALEGGYELIAIGCRGHGASKLAFGSVATRMARSTEVPILIVAT
jgi:nucleotide-binding universal stress UspA family protein